MWLCDASRSQIPDKGHPIRFHAEPNAHAALPPPKIPSRKIRRYPDVATRNQKLIMRYLLILALLAPFALTAPPTTCDIPGHYERALCAYQRRNFAEAEAGFRAIAEQEENEPRKLHATYFLARTLMKTGRFDEAAAIFVRIYTVDKAFYDTWNCDFLLGECRKALGK